MIRISRLATAFAALAAAGSLAIPASAQYTNQYSPPKLLSQAAPSVSIAGTGTVIVQVQVNPDGSHKAVRVIKTTNSGDNAAAMDIAQRSSDRPAHRGSKPVIAYYDFTLKFRGKSVASSIIESAPTGTAGEIDRLIRAHSYAAAQARAQAALASSPNDPALNAELGTANYFLNDYPAAAAAFDKVSSIPREFTQVASQSYALAAVKLQSTTPSQAVAYGQKAVALAPGPNAYFALGSSELAAGSTAAAITDLKRAHDAVMADPRADTKTKIAVASQLYAAYNKAGDAADAQRTMAEINQLAPNSSAAQTMAGNQYITQGNTLSRQGKHQDAINAYEQAAKSGSGDVQVTAYAAAALEESRLDKPDYSKMKSYADKALAINSNDALSNFAEGIALYGQYATGGSQDSSLKTQAVAELNKAKAEAQAQGNVALALNIDNFIKSQIK